MTKNSAKNVFCIDLGMTGQNSPIGAIEAIQKLPEYTTTCEVSSTSCELLRFRTDTFIKSVSGSSQTMAMLERMVEDYQNTLAKRIMLMRKVKGGIQSKFSALTGSQITDWQYCPVEQLIAQKQQYDRFVSEQKLLNTVVNKVDPFTGQPFPGTENKKPDAFGRFESSTCTYDVGDKKSDTESEESPVKIRYEPHLITADANGQIRGVFRMNPKYDPACKPIVTDQKRCAS